MRVTSFLIFVGIVLLIYFSINFLIYSRGLQVFSISPIWRRKLYHRILAHRFMLYRWRISLNTPALR